MNIFFNYDTD